MLNVRATASTGAVIDDPSPADIAELVRELAVGGDGGFLIMQGRRERRGQAYLQAVASQGTFVIERQDTAEGRLQRATALDRECVEEIFRTWAADIHDRQAQADPAPLRPAAAW